MRRSAKPLALLLAGLLSGCFSAALPPPFVVGPGEADVGGVRFPVTVGVETNANSSASDRLLRALRATGLFARVERLGEVPEAPLVASVERYVYGTATVPLLTFLTLGIVPTSVEEEHGHAFSLRPPRGFDDKLHVEATYTGTTTLGWYGLVKLASPGYCHGSPAETDEYRIFLRRTLLARAPEIDALLARAATAQR